MQSSTHGCEGYVLDWISVHGIHQMRSSPWAYDLIGLGDTVLSIPSSVPNWIFSTSEYHMLCNTERIKYLGQCIQFCNMRI